MSSLSESKIASFDIASSSANVLIIRTADQLRSYGNSPLMKTKQPLLLQLPELSAEESTAISERINHDLNECGCSLGAKFMISALLLVVGWLFTQPLMFSPALLWQLPLMLAIVVAAAGTGKMMGISRARRRAKHEVELLLKTVS